VVHDSDADTPAGNNHAGVIIVIVGGGPEPRGRCMSCSILIFLLISYANSNVRRDGPRIREKKLDNETKHNQALAKRVIRLMRKERDKKVQRAEKEEASKKDLEGSHQGSGVSMVQCAQGCSKDVRTWRI
jgi:hypothetical protein